MKNYLLIILVAILNGCNTEENNDNAYVAELSNPDSLKALNTAVTKIFKLKGLNMNNVSLEIFTNDSVHTTSFCNAPTERGDLTSLAAYVKTYSSSTTAGASVKIPILGIDGSLKKNELIQAINYIERKDVPCKINNKDTILTYGIGFTLYLHISSLAKGISASSLTQIAASVQINNQKSNAEYALQLHGISGPLVSKLVVPSLKKDFDVEGYAQLSKNIDNLGLILGDTIVRKYIKFSPELIRNIDPL